MLSSLGPLLLVAALWGVTNPFIKRGTKGLRSVDSDTLLGQAYAEITYLLFNWQYVVPWVINQMGSVVYVVTLQNCALSLAVPVANSLALAFTAATGYVLKEQPLTKRSILGIVCILSGTMLCCLDKG